MVVFSYIRKYWKSLLVVAVIFYLSVMKQPSNEKLVLFEGIDKVVHFMMYFGLSSMLWIEHLLKYKGNYRPSHLFWGAVILPVAWGGMMELAQGFFTDDRSCELMDFMANTSGVVFASACFVLFLKFYRFSK